SEAQPDLGSRRRKHAERRVTDEILVARSVDVLLVEAPAPAAEHVEHHPATELSDVATEQPMGLRVLVAAGPGLDAAKVISAVKRVADRDRAAITESILGLGLDPVDDPIGQPALVERGALKVQELVAIREVEADPAAARTDDEAQRGRMIEAVEVELAQRLEVGRLADPIQ